MIYNNFLNQFTFGFNNESLMKLASLQSSLPQLQKLNSSLQLKCTEPDCLHLVRSLSYNVESAQKSFLLSQKYARFFSNKCHHAFGADRQTVSKPVYLISIPHPNSEERCWCLALQSGQKGGGVEQRTKPQMCS